MPALKSPEESRFGQVLRHLQKVVLLLHQKQEPRSNNQIVDYYHNEEYLPQMAFGMYKPAGWTETEL